MKKSLKFKRAIGYWENNSAGYLVVELEDGRYGGICTALEEESDNVVKGHIGGDKIGYMRGRTITENIPQEMIEKAIRILENPNSKIRVG